MSLKLLCWTAQQVAKKSTNQKDSSTTVTSEKNVDIAIIKIMVTNEIIFKEMNFKNYSAGWTVDQPNNYRLSFFS